MTSTQELEHRLELRNLRIADFKDIHEIMEKIYTKSAMGYTRNELKRQIQKFPEGQIGIEDNGKIVAAALSIIVDYSKFGDRHTYKQITGNGKFDTHEPDGDTLYGTDVFGNPEYPGMRLERRLYDARKQLCENLNARAIIEGGRIPGYKERSDKLRPREYIREVKDKNNYDPVLSFQLANEF